MSEENISAVLKLMPYGFYPVGSHNEDDDNIMVLNWITQASFEPQLVVLGIQKSSHSYGLIKKSKVFSVNIFSKADQDAVKPFTKSRAKKPDKMEGVEFERAPETQCPLLPQAAAFIECQVREIFETGGDHNLVLAEVVNAELRKELDVEEALTLSKIGWDYAG